MTETARSDRLPQAALVAPARSTAALWAGTVAGLLLGAVLLVSAWGKALDAHGTAEIYAKKGLLPAALAPAIIVVACGVEALLGGALLVNLRRRWVVLAASALMLAFLGITAYEYVYPSQDASSCGCFGNIIVRTPGAALAGDAVFFVLALLAWIGRPVGRRGGWRWAVPAVLGAAGIALAIAAPSLPLDNLATKLKPGADLKALAKTNGMDTEVPELVRGKALIVLLDPAQKDDAARAEVARLNTGLHLTGDPAERKVNVIGIVPGDHDTAQAFGWEMAPAFEVRALPFSTLKPLYRRLPRTFTVQDGIVQRTWSGVPDDATLAALAAGKDS